MPSQKGPNLTVQLLIEFFSAFLGFLFAILLAWLTNRHVQKKKYNQVLDCLQNELADLAKPLEKYVQSKTALHYPIATPVWDAMKSSGMVLDLIGKPFFDNLIGTFSQIEAYNSDRFHADDAELLERLEGIAESIGKVLPQIEAERKS